MANWQWFALGTAFGIASTALTIARWISHAGQTEGQDR